MSIFTTKMHIHTVVLFLDAAEILSEKHTEMTTLVCTHTYVHMHYVFNNNHQGVLLWLQLSTALISSLMARHSGEVGVTDEIASRLRETTPSLFSQSNAIIAKANELVSIATATEEKFDQLSKLRDSVKVGGILEAGSVM